MWQLILLLLIVGSVLISIRYYRHLQQEKLRNNPPERALFQILLPPGEFESDKKLATIFESIKKKTADSTETRKTGMGQATFNFVRSTKNNQNMLRVYGLFDPGIARDIESEFSSAFDGAVGFFELPPDADPLREAYLERRARPSETLDKEEQPL